MTVNGFALRFLSQSFPKGEASPEQQPGKKVYAVKAI